MNKAPTFAALCSIPVFLISVSLFAIDFQIDSRDTNLGLGEQDVAATPVGSNPADNYGDQRRNVILQAMSLIGPHLKGDVPVKVRIFFNHVDMDCFGTDALYSSGRPLTYGAGADHYLLPHPTAYHPAPLYNNLIGERRISADNNDMELVFNRLRNSITFCPAGLIWYYGYDGMANNPPVEGINQEDLLTHALRSLVKGLGVTTPYHSSNGALAGGPGNAPSFMDYLLKNRATNSQWRALNNSQRAALTSESYDSTTDIIFDGPSSRVHSKVLTSGRDALGRINMVGASGGAGLGDYTSPTNYNLQAFARSGVHLHPTSRPAQFMRRSNGQTAHQVYLALAMLRDVGWQLYESDLELSSTVADVNPSLSENFNISYQVFNRGPDTAENVVVTVSLPDNLTSLTHTGDGSYSNGRWEIGSLTNGQTATLTFTGRSSINQTGSFSAQIIASSRFDPDSLPDNNQQNEDDQAVDSLIFGAAVPDIALEIGATRNGGLLLSGVEKSLVLNLRQLNPQHTSTISSSFNLWFQGAAEVTLESESITCSASELIAGQIIACSASVSSDSPASMRLNIETSNPGAVSVHAETINAQQDYQPQNNLADYILHAVTGVIPAHAVLSVGHTLRLEQADFQNNNYPEILLIDSAGDLKKVNNQQGVLQVDNVPLASSVQDLAVGDLNNDQVIDVVVKGTTASRHLIISDAGQAAVGTAIPDSALAAGDDKFLLKDLDNDGYQDLVVASSSGFSRAYIQDQNAFPETGKLQLAKNNVNDLLVADFNGSNTPDVVIARADGPLGFWRRMPAESGVSFRPDNIDFLQSGASVAVNADLNGDNYQDIIAAYNARDSIYRQSMVRIYLNNGRGRFELSEMITTNAVKDLKIGDANNDGSPDLAVLAMDGTLVAYLQQNQQWSLAPYGSHVAAATDLLIFDINNDQQDDLAVSHSNGISLFVQFGQVLPDDSLQIVSGARSIGGGGALSQYLSLILGALFIVIGSWLFSRSKVTKETLR